MAEKNDPQSTYDEFEARQALTDIGRMVFDVPEEEELEVDLSTLVHRVSQLVTSERRLRTVFFELAVEVGLRELADEVPESQTPPDAGHGAGDGFGGVDFD